MGRLLMWQLRLVRAIVRTQLDVIACREKNVLRRERETEVKSDRGVGASPTHRPVCLCALSQPHLCLQVAVQNVPVVEIGKAHGQLRNPVQHLGLRKEPSRGLLLLDACGQVPACGAGAAAGRWEGGGAFNAAAVAPRWKPSDARTWSRPPGPTHLCRTPCRCRGTCRRRERRLCSG